MTKKTLNGYFKILCNAYCIVQREQKRLKKRMKKEKDTILNIEYHSLQQHKQALIDEIEEIIEEANKNNFKITITTRQQVVFFINFFSTRHCPNRYCLISLNEEDLKKYPAKNKLCTEFYKAYCLKDDEEIRKLSKRTF